MTPSFTFQRRPLARWAVVDAIYEAADLKLTPQPLPASDEMRSTRYVVRHDELIAEQRTLRDAPDNALTAGPSQIPP